ncbi:MAG: exodeoxyribonuclease III [Buchananella hordeovulneris]|nr:exodeoxyribonuclease III [Buchananella hordeovulneris]
MKITTVNVNGVRAAYRRGMGEWLAASTPDVLLLQEVRAPLGTAGEFLGEGWHVAEVACEIKGRAGVAVASRVAPLAVRTFAYEGELPVDTGRWVEVDLPLPGRDVPLTVVSAYLHSGEVGTEKMDAKYHHLDRVSERLEALMADVAAGRRELLVAGDFNVVISERDIKNWKPNHNKTAGVLDEEIAYLKRWLGLGMVDVVRQLHGEEQGPYTWWSWRGRAFDNNAGWRIDYQFVSPGIAAAGRSYAVERAETNAERFSDHAPLSVTYQL